MEVVKQEPDKKPKAPKVFIAYAHEDQDKALKLYEDLERAGCEPWIDKKKLLPGKRWRLALRKAIKTSDFFLACLSTKSVSKIGSFQTELKEAYEVLKQYPSENIYLIPICLEKCDVPEELEEHNWVNLFEPEGFTLILQALEDEWERRGHKWPESTLMSFYRARQRVSELAKQQPQTAELLSAGVLRTLYLNRFAYSPAEQERRVLFRNLLIRGRSRYLKRRATKVPTPTSEAAPAPLGWFWFSDLLKKQAVNWIRQEIFHANINVRAGAVRGLGRFGSATDSSMLRNKLDDNPRVAAEAVRALARLGTADDIDYIRGFQDDRRDEVLIAVAGALAQRGSNADVTIILNLLEHTNPSVRRGAAKALGFIGTPEQSIPILEAILDDPTQHEQVKAAAAKALERLNNVLPEPRSWYERAVRHKAYGLGLSDDYSEENRAKARELLFDRGLAREAALRWMVSHESPEEITRIIAEHGIDLPFRVLQEFDYHVYCPQWWRDAMDQLVD